MTHTFHGPRLSILLSLGLALCLAPIESLAAQPPDPPQGNADPLFQRDSFRLLEVAPIELDRTVGLQGAFDSESGAARIRSLVGLAAPAAETREAVRNPEGHLTAYKLEPAEREPIRLVVVKNKFGTQRLTLGQPRLLLLPASVKWPEGAGVLDSLKVPAAAPPDPAAAPDPNPPAFGQPDGRLPDPANPAEPDPFAPAGPLPAPSDSSGVLPPPKWGPEPADGPRLAPAAFAQPPANPEGPATQQSPSDQPAPPPAGQDDPGEPDERLALDHYKVYEIIEQHCVKPLMKQTACRGRHGHEQRLTLRRPKYLAVPAEKLHGEQRSEIVLEDEFLTIYETDASPKCRGTVEADDQFGKHLLSLCKTSLLAVPSRVELIAAPNRLDHLLVEKIDPLAVEHQADLEGLFETTAFPARLKHLTLLASAVGVHGRPPTRAADRLTGYAIEQDFPDPVRTIRVWNEFGEQELTLGRPVRLLVPAREKGIDGEPGTLDHYKCFVVLKACCGSSHQVTVRDPDGVDRAVAVGGPKLFCVPVAKTLGGTTEQVSDWRTNLVIYATTVRKREVESELTDQFGSRTVTRRAATALGVPSLLLGSFPPLPKKQPPADPPPAGEQSVSFEGPQRRR